MEKMEAYRSPQDVHLGRDQGMGLLGLRVGTGRWEAGSGQGHPGLGLTGGLSHKAAANHCQSAKTAAWGSPFLPALSSWFSVSWGCPGEAKSCTFRVCSCPQVSRAPQARCKCRECSLAERTPEGTPEGQRGFSGVCGSVGPLPWNGVPRGASGLSAWGTPGSPW